MTPSQSCANCRFSRSAGGPRLQCLRFPPQFHPLTAVPLVPAVLSDFWCGEWAADPSKGPGAALKDPSPL